MTLNEFLKYLDCACTDGSCIFRPSNKKGMVTNGGCNCAGNYSKRRELERLIRFMRGKLDERI